MLILKRIWELISRLLSGRSRVRIAPGPPLSSDDPFIKGFHKYLECNEMRQDIVLTMPTALRFYVNYILSNEPPLDEKTTDSGHQTATGIMDMALDRQLRQAFLSELKARGFEGVDDDDVGVMLDALYVAANASGQEGGGDE